MYKTAMWTVADKKMENTQISNLGKNIKKDSKLNTIKGL